MSVNKDPVQTFRNKAALVAVTLKEAANLDEAIDYIIETCAAKAPCEILIRKEGEEYGPDSENGLPTSKKRIIASPDMAKRDPEAYEQLQGKAGCKGFECIASGLRNYSGGYDIGVAYATLGIAQSASCMVESSNEETRLSTMTCEICMLLLPKSKIVEQLEDAAPILRELLAGPSYTAIITGPSRTADIERVTTLGAHGPVELHIIMLEG